MVTFLICWAVGISLAVAVGVSLAVAVGVSLAVAVGIVVLLVLWHWFMNGVRSSQNGRH